MAKVLTQMCMSLDGFIAQPDDNPAELFDWYWIGDVVVPSAQEGMTFSVDAASALMLQELTSGCGALVAGWRLFDQTDGWGDNHPAGAPVVVVTHRPPPDDAAERFPRTSFTGSVEEGIATAKEIAGDKFVTIASACDLRATPGRLRATQGPQRRLWRVATRHRPGPRSP
jgi:dihydrofolate reductase